MLTQCCIVCACWASGSLLDRVAMGTCEVFLIGSSCVGASTSSTDCGCVVDMGMGGKGKDVERMLAQRGKSMKFIEHVKAQAMESSSDYSYYASSYYSDDDAKNRRYCPSKWLGEWE